MNAIELGNLCHTAKQLGISRNALYRRLKRHRIAINRVDGLSVDSSGAVYVAGHNDKIVVLRKK